MKYRLFGEILEDQFSVPGEEIEKALKFQREYEGKLGEILLNSGLISEEQITAVLSRQFGKNSLSTVNNCHQAASTHSASVSRFVRRATRSRFGMFEPWPLSKTIFLKPW